MSIKIISSGALTTIQDYGRLGYGNIGISPSGAVDSEAMEIANILVGNDKKEAVIECTLFGPTISFTKDNVIAITGADMKPKVNGREIPMYQAVEIKALDKLELGLVTKGCRTYLSFAGGLKIEEYLGSKSTNIKCKMGGFCGRSLHENDEIEFVNPVKTIPYLERHVYKDLKTDKFPKTIRVVMGPQDDYFTKEGIGAFLTGNYKLTNDSDRMACKLTGPTILSRETTDIISDGVPLGAIQVSSNGQPMIMLSDRQTIGGYAKIGTVISSDISILAQCKPGDEIRFQNITLREAQKLYKKHYKEIKRLQKRIKG